MSAGHRSAGGYIPVVAAVIARDDRLLLCRRRSGPHLGRLWEFPGGKVEPGEDPRAALARELREELDVHARVGALLAQVFHTYPEKRVWLRFYRCRIAGSPRPIVHERLAWVPFADLARYPAPPPNAVVLAALQR